jgi:hypothetical protein
MSSSPLSPLVSEFDLTTSWQVLYQVPSTALRTGLDAIVFNNYSGANVTYSFRLVQSGGGGGSLSELITDKPIRAFSSDLSPAVIGQSILKAGVIEAKCSANSSVSVNITGTVINDD